MRPALLDAARRQIAAGHVFYQQVCRLVTGLNGSNGGRRQPWLPIGTLNGGGGWLSPAVCVPIQRGSHDCWQAVSGSRVWVAVACLSNLLWIELNVAPPRMWDDAEYLADSVTAYDALERRDWRGFLRAASRPARSVHPPMTKLAPIPMYVLFGPGTSSALYASTALIPLFCLYVFLLARLISRSTGTAIVAVMVTCCFPLTYGLWRHVMAEFGLAVATVAAHVPSGLLCRTAAWLYLAWSARGSVHGMGVALEGLVPGVRGRPPLLSPGPQRGHLEVPCSTAPHRGPGGDRNSGPHRGRAVLPAPIESAVGVYRLQHHAQRIARAVFARPGLLSGYGSQVLDNPHQHRPVVLLVHRVRRPRDRPAATPHVAAAALDDVVRWLLWAPAVGGVQSPGT